VCVCIYVSQTVQDRCDHTLPKRCATGKMELSFSFEDSTAVSIVNMSRLRGKYIQHEYARQYTILVACLRQHIVMRYRDKERDR